MLDTAAMELAFTKMTGAGNDFVMLDNRDRRLALSPAQIARLCDRRFGIGADGLLLVEPSPAEGVDFAMRYFNADGGEAEMCGNGARCFARFAADISAWTAPAMNFQTGAGLVRAEFHGDRVTINLTPPKDIRLNVPIVLRQGAAVAHHCNTGVPHAVLFMDNVQSVNVAEIGAELRWHEDHQPRGTNANFVQVTGPGAIRVRTYERGVEGETLACGTGVAASAILAHLAKGVPAPVRVQVQGGDILDVAFETNRGAIANVRLTGPAVKVFTGRINL